MPEPRFSVRRVDIANNGFRLMELVDSHDESAAAIAAASVLNNKAISDGRPQRYLACEEEFVKLHFEWCVVDDSPVAICGGPHIQHEHDGYVVSLRPNQTCPLCQSKNASA